MIMSFQNLDPLLLNIFFSNLTVSPNLKLHKRDCHIDWLFMSHGFFDEFFIVLTWCIVYGFFGKRFCL